MTLTVPSALGEDWEKVEKSAPLSTKAAQAVATSARMKGRGLTVDSSIAARSRDIIHQSPVR
jgi:hypothetical protein